MLLQFTLTLDNYCVKAHEAMSFGISRVGVQVLNHLQISSDFTWHMRTGRKIKPTSKETTRLRYARKPPDLPKTWINSNSHIPLLFFFSSASHSFFLYLVMANNPCISLVPLQKGALVWVVEKHFFLFLSFSLSAIKELNFRAECNLWKPISKTHQSIGWSRWVKWERVRIFYNLSSVCSKEEFNI